MADDAITAVSVDRIGGLYPGIRPLAYRTLQDVKKMSSRVMNVVQGRRSMSDQLAVYAKGRQFIPADGSAPLPVGVVPMVNIAGYWVVSDQKLIVTNAKPGLSWHCYGLAFDCAWAGQDPYLQSMPQAARDALWQVYGSCVRMNSLRWGGDTIHLVNGVSDLPHAELTYGMPLASAHELFDQGGIQAVWAYLDSHRGVPVGQDWNLGPQDG